MVEKVELKIVVDEEEIEVNEFVQILMGKMIGGAASALKGVKEDWERIEITVKREVDGKKSGLAARSVL